MSVDPLTLEVRNLDNRMAYMLRELRRYGITKSDGGVEGHAKSATSGAVGCTDEPSGIASSVQEGGAGVESGLSELFSRKRVCSVCGIEKFAAEFHKEKRKPVGLAACCRMCIKAIRKGRHKKYSQSVEPPDRARARSAVKRAVRKGKLVKPPHCQRCGGEFPKEKLHGHHHDYARPLDVKWLCSSCHGLEHMDPLARIAEAIRTSDPSTEQKAA